MSVIEEGPVSLVDAPVRRLNMVEAINDALAVMLERDSNVVIFGEDVGYFGGVFRATAGLQKKFGSHRVFDTPINECGIIGAAVGMGAYGLRPVPEIQFADYIYPGLDQLISEAARLPGCNKNSARTACSIPRSTNAGSSARRWGWGLTACARYPKSSSPTISTPGSTS